MTTWTGRTSDGTYGLLIEEPVLGALDQMCRDAGVIETGGILVGLYSADLAVAIVREATPPPTDSHRGHSWFERGVAGLRDMLRQRWRSKERSYYLGEWHFHPAPRVEPSSDDFAQMASIADAAGYDCKEPVLVILGEGQNGGRREMRAFVCAKGTAPAELVASEEPRARVTS